MNTGEFVFQLGFQKILKIRQICVKIFIRGHYFCMVSSYFGFKLNFNRGTKEEGFDWEV